VSIIKIKQVQNLATTITSIDTRVGAIPAGAQGSQGRQGPQGIIGSTGAQGNQGPTGFQGRQGPQGNQGPTGFQGNQGPTGFQGIIGVQGAFGAQGIQGTFGAQGAQGPTGFQGFQGRQGPNGLNSTVAGPQGRQGPQGDRGFQGFQGNQGPTGLTGFQGFQGNQGPTGIQGTFGAQGNQGPTGFQGFTGFQGNQGPTGFQGIIGNTGAQGNQGPTGIQGTVGTLGAQGRQGPTGPQGTNGTLGAQGRQGPTGPQGTNGTNGTNGGPGPQGSAGSNGSPGTPGSNGTNGGPGPQGFTGPAGSYAYLSEVDNSGIKELRFNSGTMTGQKELVVSNSQFTAITQGMFDFYWYDAAMMTTTALARFSYGDAFISNASGQFRVFNPNTALNTFEVGNSPSTGLTFNSGKMMGGAFKELVASSNQFSAITGGMFEFYWYDAAMMNTRTVANFNSSNAYFMNSSGSFSVMNSNTAMNTFEIANSPSIGLTFNSGNMMSGAFKELVASSSSFIATTGGMFDFYWYDAAMMNTKTLLNFSSANAYFMNSSGSFSVMDYNTAMNTLQVSSTSFQVTVNGGTLSFNGTDLLVNAMPIGGGGGGFTYLSEFSYSWDPGTTILKFDTGAMFSPYQSFSELEVSRNSFTATNQGGNFMFNYWDAPMQSMVMVFQIGNGGTYIYNSSSALYVYDSATYQTSFEVSNTTFQVRVNGGTFSFDGMGLNVNGMPVGGGGGGGGGGFTYFTEGPNQYNSAITELKFNTGSYGQYSRELTISKQEFSVMNDMGQFIINKWNSMMGYQEMVAYISGMSSMFYTDYFSISTSTYNELLNITDTKTEISNSNKSFKVKAIGYNAAYSMDCNEGSFFIENMMGGLYVNGTMQGFQTFSVSEYGGTVRNVNGDFNVQNSAYSDTFTVASVGATSNGWYTYSDITLKDNIIPIPSSLNKVMSLEGVKFDWKRDMSADYGFIAQQVKEILPEVVNENNGLLTVNYTSIIAVQNEAIKELNKKIDKYDGIIDNLTKEIDKLRPA
jgi:uncharacterized protein YcfL